MDGCMGWGCALLIVAMVAKLCYRVVRFLFG